MLSKIVCGCCGIELNSKYFIQDNSLTSICKMCIAMGNLPENFPNLEVMLYSKVTETVYLGSREKVKTSKSKYSRIINELTQRLTDFSEELFIQTILEDVLKSSEVLDKVVSDEISISDYLNSLGLCDSIIIRGELVRPFTQDQKNREYIRKKYNYVCQYCHLFGDSVDHREPLNRGGADSEDNCVCSCTKCNKLKGNMTYNEWLTIISPQQHLVDLLGSKYQDSLTLTKDLTKRRAIVKEHNLTVTDFKQDIKGKDLREDINTLYTLKVRLDVEIEDMISIFHTIIYYQIRSNHLK